MISFTRKSDQTLLTVSYDRTFALVMKTLSMYKNLLVLAVVLVIAVVVTWIVIIPSYPVMTLLGIAFVPTLLIVFLIVILTFINTFYIKLTYEPAHKTICVRSDFMEGSQSRCHHLDQFKKVEVVYIHKPQQLFALKVSQLVEKKLYIEVSEELHRNAGWQSFLGELRKDASINERIT